MSALVSCVVPVHDGERFLGPALDSILAQTHREVEAIVVDDGSSDGTPEVIASYGTRIRSVRQENAGHASARNRGIEVARGTFLAFLDADDLWHPEKLARQLARFAERPELELCFSWLRNFTEGSDAVEDVPGYTSVALLARRAVIERIGDFDPSLRHGNDRDWMLRAAEAGTVIELLPDVLVYRRLHGANRSLQLAEASRAEYLRIVKASLDRRRASGQGLSHDFGADSGAELHPARKLLAGLVPAPPARLLLEACVAADPGEAWLRWRSAGARSGARARRRHPTAGAAAAPACTRRRRGGERRRAPHLPAGRRRPRALALRALRRAGGTGRRGAPGRRRRAPRLRRPRPRRGLRRACAAALPRARAPGGGGRRSGRRGGRSLPPGSSLRGVICSAIPRASRSPCARA